MTKVKTKHLREPWYYCTDSADLRACAVGIRSATPDVGPEPAVLQVRVLHDGSQRGVSEADATARRLIACVNALQDVPNVEAIPLLIHSLKLQAHHKTHSIKPELWLQRLGLMEVPSVQQQPSLPSFGSSASKTH